MIRVLVDTCVWYAVLDPRDSEKSKRNIIHLTARIETSTLIVPWPILYETLSSRLARNKPGLAALQLRLKGPRVAFIDDAPYREQALSDAFDSSLHRGRPLSLIDCLIRAVLHDGQLDIRALATFNGKDFADVCAPKDIEILS